MSRDIIITDWNESLVSAVYNIDTNNPEIICKVSTIPSIKPMFHISEIEVGVGRSNSDFFIKFVTGFNFISCIFI